MLFTIRLTDSPDFRALFVILLLTSCLYSQTLGYEFLNLDDNVYITENPHVQGGLTAENIEWAWTKLGSPYYMPLTRLSYLLDVELFGLKPIGFRLSSILLHLLNVILAFLIAGYLFRDLWQKIMLASLVAFHPQHVEAVVWISQRKEILAAFFGLSSVLLYLKSRSYSREFLKSFLAGTSTPLLLSLLFFIFSLLSKPTWVVLPVLLLLVDYFYVSKTQNYKLPHSISQHIPFFMISLGYSILHLYATATSAGYVVTSAKTLDISQRIINAPVIIFEYLSKGLVPYPLAGYQPYPLQPISIYKIIFSVITIVSLWVMVYLYRERNRLLYVGICWFLVSLGPVIGIIGIGESIFIGDRWTYLPHIGLFIALISILSTVIAAKKMTSRKLKVISAVYLCVLFLIAVTVSQHWRDGGSYWTWSLETTSDNHYAHYKAGEFYERSGLRQRADYHYNEAHRINPSEYLYALRLGNFYSSSDSDTAISFFMKLLDSAPSPAPSTFKMGIVFLIHHHYDNARLFFKRNIEQELALPQLSADYFLSHLYLFHLLSMADDQQKANEYLDIVFEKMPHDHDTSCKFVYKELKKIETLTGMRASSDKLDVHCGNNSS